MSGQAEQLRTAAKAMRERAEAATPGEPGWYAGRERRQFESIGDVYSSREPSATSRDICSYATTEDAAHIASWHPAVALAVADWLDATAAAVAAGSWPPYGAEAVARAYLGQTP